MYIFWNSINGLRFTAIWWAITIIIAVNLLTNIKVIESLKNKYCNNQGESEQ
jgi:hypothetical protein